MTSLLQSRNLFSEELHGVLSNASDPTFEPSTSSSGDKNRYRNESTAYDLDTPLESNDEPTSSMRTLTTFSGVFCPVALSQFSTLVFLRMGFVIGQSGIVQFSVELTLAYIILWLTVLSICAISTNGEIQGGGIYFMISRTLGPEFGGALGLLFFFANVFSCGLYISGFVEGFLATFGLHANGNLAHFLPDDSAYWKYLYCFVILTACLAICLVGGSLFARTSAFILMVLVACYVMVVVSLFFHSPISVPIPENNKYIYPNDSDHSTVSFNFTGPRLDTLLENVKTHYTVDYTITDTSPMNFARVFAILFSSVTGIMNGANLSGELRKPSESIPRGTILATLFTFVCYILLGLAIGSSCQYQLLVNNYNFLIPINFWPYFVVIGFSAATLSAALGNLIGASRILAALAKDGVFGAPLKPAAITTAAGNPIPAVAISYVLVLLVMLIGSLNTIAPIVTCFFLLAYASTNLACAALDLASAPNFRPTFKFFHWGASLAGLLGSLVMGFLVSYIYTPVSIMTMLGLMILLHLRSLPQTWGSISQALIFHQVRKYLLLLDLRKYHVKFWRPQILFLVSEPRSSAQAIKFVNDLKKGGLYVLGHVFPGGPLEEMTEDPAETQLTEWLSVVDELRVKAFVELTVAPDVRSGAHQLIRISGLGGMKPNTVCLGFREPDADRGDDAAAADLPSCVPLFAINSADAAPQLPRHLPRDIASQSEYARLLCDALQLGKDLLVTRNMAQLDPAVTKRQIDVWPMNFFLPGMTGYVDTTCLLQLQFACVLSTARRWRRRARIRVFLCVDASSHLVELTARLDRLLRDLRIRAQTHVLDWRQVLADDPEAAAGGAGDGSGEGVSDAYLTAVNQCIRLQSPGTGAAFLYLPRPPADPGLHSRYLAQLDILTRGLPPTVMVHGIHKVFSRNL